MKNKRKGFTLAELLIVVAIVGILVAISVPIFTNQLKKARLATNQANAREALSAVLTTWMTEDSHQKSSSEGKEITGKGQGQSIYQYDPATGNVTFVKDLETTPGIQADAIGAKDWHNVENNIAEWTVDTPVGDNHTLGSKVLNNYWYVTIDNSDGSVAVFYVQY